MKRVLAIVLCLALTFSLSACQGSSSSSAASTASSNPSSSSASNSSAASSSSSASSKTGSSEPVNVRVALFSDGANMSSSQKTVFDSFVKEYPNIHPTFEYITSDSYGSNWNGYLMKIQTMVAANDAPDTIALGLEGVSLLVMNNLAVPMNSFLDSHKKEFSSIIDAENTELMKIFEVDNKLYGIPYEANCVVTHINKKIFQQAGVEIPKETWTWDDFVGICEKIKKSGVKAYAFGVPTNFFCLQALLYSNGGSPLNKDWTAGTINSDECVSTMQFLQDAIYKNGYAPEPSDTITDIELMTQGKIAMGWWGRWVSNDYNASKFYDTVTVQTVPGGKGGNTTCAGTACYVTLKSSKHQDEAMTVAAWCAGETYTKTFMSTGSLPANFKVGAEICKASENIMDNWQIMYDIYNKGMWRRSCDPPEYTELANIYSDMLSTVYSNQSNAKDALTKANDQINSVFAKSTYRDTAEKRAIVASLYKR